MNKWKSWVSIAALSIGLIGCANAGDDQTMESAYNGTALNLNNEMYRDGTGVHPISPFAADDAERNGIMTNPRTYKNNSIYKEGAGETGILSRDGISRFGYAEYSKEDLSPQQASTYYVDRNVLARSIGSVVTAIPEVEKSYVLVTDEDLFVGVPGITDPAALNKVKLSAWAMAPRWYKISVSSDQQTTASVKSMVTNRNINESQLEGIFKQNTIDMTGTNVRDSGQNKTDYNINQTFPNTNGTHKHLDR